MLETLEPQFKTSRIHLTWSRSFNNSVKSIAQHLANSSHRLSWLHKERKEDLQDQPLPSVEEKRTQVKEPRKCKIYWPMLAKFTLSNSLGTLKEQLSQKRGQIRSRFWKISMILTMWLLRLRLFVLQLRICQFFIAQ